MRMLALPLVLHLRTLGHDVLTSLDAGNANSAVPDVEVLAFATNQERIMLTYNRRHFLQIHRSGCCTIPGWYFASLMVTLKGKREEWIRQSLLFPTCGVSLPLLINPNRSTSTSIHSGPPFGRGKLSAPAKEAT